MNYLDLTHKFTNDMPVYPGDPKPEIKFAGTIANEGYNWLELRTGLHVGTHIDAPLHFVAGGKKISDFPPEKFIGRGVLIDARGQKEIGSQLINDLKITEGDVVLFWTGFDEKFRQPEYFTDYPVLTPELAEKLITYKIKMLGTDTPSPDKAPYEVHQILLGAEILIIENLTNLKSLQGAAGFEVMALPPAFATEAAPVRVIAKI